jgi:hypothetical protein
VKRVAELGALILLMVACVIAAVLALLAAWSEPWGGEPGDGERIVPALRAEGAALQSAPQADRARYLATKREQAAASGAAR